MRQGGARVPRARLPASRRSRRAGRRRARRGARSSAAASRRGMAPYSIGRGGDRARAPAGSSRPTLKNPPTKYVQAWFDRLAWWQHPRAFFETYDLLLTPTIACPPFTVGLDNPAEIAGKPVEALRLDSVHVSVQRDGPAGRVGAVRLHEGRSADRAADRRPSLRRRRPCSRASRGVRARASVGPAPSGAGLTGGWSGSCSSCRKGVESSTTRCAWCSDRSAASR